MIVFFSDILLLNLKIQITSPFTVVLSSSKVMYVMNLNVYKISNYEDYTTPIVKVMPRADWPSTRIYANNGRSFQRRACVISNFNYNSEFCLLYETKEVRLIKNPSFLYKNMATSWKYFYFRNIIGSSWWLILSIAKEFFEEHVKKKSNNYSVPFTNSSR